MLSKQLTYKVRHIFVQHAIEATTIMDFIGARWQRSSHANQTDVVEWRFGVVLFREKSLALELLIQSLADCRVCTISTNQDISMVTGVVITAEHCTAGILLNAEYFLVIVDFILGDKLSQDLLQLWTFNDVNVIAISGGWH